MRASAGGYGQLAQLATGEPATKHCVVEKLFSGLAGHRLPGVTRAALLRFLSKICAV